MIFSIIIPCYNEKDVISECLDGIRAVDLGDIQKEIIIVDDGSTDGTREILKKIKGEGIRVIYHSSNLGKGFAIKSALKQVSGNMVIIQDADLEYDPRDYRKLITPVLKNQADVVYGSRFLNKFWPENMQFKYWIGNKVFSSLANILYGAGITDEATCYKVFRTDLLKSLSLESTSFDFCPEVTAKIRKKGIKIYEVPISFRARRLEEGKKITWKDGLVAIWTLIKYRFRD